MEVVPDRKSRAKIGHRYEYICLREYNRGRTLTQGHMYEWMGGRTCTNKARGVTLHFHPGVGDGGV